MQRSIVWDCLNCGERNYTNHDAANPICWKCKRVYSWQSMAFTAGVSHEETLDDDGNFDADAWIPDFDDDDEGEIIHDMPDWYVGFGMENEPSPAPPEGYIALSDTEIEAAEAEDMEFRRCGECGVGTEIVDFG